MSDRPPYHPQETEYSCGAACLRMVLQHLGVVRTEAELRALTDSEFGGNFHLDTAVEAPQFELEHQDGKIEGTTSKFIERL